jgi:MFS family permease
MLVVVMVICSTAKVMNTFIGGMTIVGFGAGICDLTALAATSELAPTRKRGKYVAVLVFTVVPYCPSVLWGQLIAANAGWRHYCALCEAWAAVGLFATLAFYFPPPRVNSRGLTRKQIMTEVGWVGGFLTIAGMILFMAGLQWGGYQVSPRSSISLKPHLTEWNQYAWTSAHVLVPLLGAFFLASFCVWEVYGAKYPMFPSRLNQEPKILVLTLMITFISGANFFSVIMFWPT